MIKIDTAGITKQLKKIAVLSNPQGFMKQVSKSYINNIAYDMKKNTINEVWRAKAKRKTSFKPSNSFSVKNSDGIKPAIIDLTANLQTKRMEKTEFRKSFVYRRITGGIRSPAGTWFVRKSARDGKRQTASNWLKRRDGGMILDRKYNNPKYDFLHGTYLFKRYFKKKDYSFKHFRTERGVWENTGDIAKLSIAQTKTNEYFNNKNSIEILKPAHDLSMKKSQKLFDEAVAHAKKKFGIN